MSNQVQIIESSTLVGIPASNIVQILATDFLVDIDSANQVSITEQQNSIILNSLTTISVIEDLVNVIELGIQGPQGAQGATGAQGPQGIQGPPGEPGTTDHGLLTGLADDDHTQYHTDARALTWLGTRSTTDLAEGTNLYFTNERVDDRVGSLLVAGSNITLTYSDPSNTLTIASAAVTGAASSTDNAIARFDSTTGKIIQNSDVTVDDSNVISRGTTNANLDIRGNGTGEVRLGDGTNYAAFQADGDLDFAGTAKYLVNQNAYAFAVDGFPLAGLFFSTTGGGTYDFLDASAVSAFKVIVDSSALAVYGMAYSPYTPSQITSNQNNYALTEAGYIRLSSDAARDITGFASPADTRAAERTLHNVGSFTITLKHQNTSSSSFNRIKVSNSADYALLAGGIVKIIYDPTQLRWIPQVNI